MTLAQDILKDLESIMMYRGELPEEGQALAIINEHISGMTSKCDNKCHDVKITCYEDDLSSNEVVVGSQTRVWLDGIEVKGLRAVEYKSHYKDVQEVTITILARTLNGGE